MQETLYPLVYVLAFVAVVLLVQALSGIMLKSQDKTRSMNRRLAMLDTGMKPVEVYAALVRNPAAVAGKFTDFQANYRRASLYLGQAGLTISVTRLALITGGIAVGIWVMSLVSLQAAGGAGFLQNLLLSFLASVVLSAIGVFLWVSRRRNARLRLLEEQMPLALDVINRALRAGHPVVSAVHLASSEMGDPIGSEFGLIVDETTYGFEFKEALTNFANRTGSADAFFFAVCVGIQSETGGNLAEILSGLATVVRARSTLRKRVKALASEGRASANILSALPAMMIAFMALTKPTFYSSKFSDPIFWPTVGIVGLVYLFGWYMIHRIVNFKY